MVSSCVNFKSNNHIANLRKDNIFHHDNGFLGERIKRGVNYSPWMINQLGISLRTKERVKKAKPGVVSAVLTSNDAVETKVS
jgi:glucose-1-phosphate adenylyltransferase